MSHGQHGFGRGHARPHCRHVEAALRASVLDAAALLDALRVAPGPQGPANPFEP